MGRDDKSIEIGDVVWLIGYANLKMCVFDKWRENDDAPWNYSCEWFDTDLHLQTENFKEEELQVSWRRPR